MASGVFLGLVMMLYAFFSANSQANSQAEPSGVLRRLKISAQSSRKTPPFVIASTITK
jgi:hypothetical protein